MTQVSVLFSSRNGKEIELTLATECRRELVVPVSCLQ